MHRDNQIHAGATASSRHRPESAPAARRIGAVARQLTLLLASAAAISVASCDDDGEDAARALSLPNGALPTEWKIAPVGSYQGPLKDPGYEVGAAGDRFGLRAGGAGIAPVGTVDEHLFVHREVSGDMGITARVAAIEDCGAGAAFGVMLRPSTDGDSSYVLSAATGPEGIAQQGRTFQADLAVPLRAGRVPKAPFWVRVERRGTALVAGYSADGKAWSTNAIPSPLPPKIQVGLVATSGDRNRACAAIFDKVTVGPAQFPAPTYMPVVVPDGGVAADAAPVTGGAPDAGAPDAGARDAGAPGAGPDATTDRGDAASALADAPTQDAAPEADAAPGGGAALADASAADANLSPGLGDAGASPAADAGRADAAPPAMTGPRPCNTVPIDGLPEPTVRQSTDAPPYLAGGAIKPGRYVAKSWENYASTDESGTPPRQFRTAISISAVTSDTFVAEYARVIPPGPAAPPSALPSISRWNERWTRRGTSLLVEGTCGSGASYVSGYSVEGEDLLRFFVRRLPSGAPAFEITRFSRVP